MAPKPNRLVLPCTVCDPAVAGRIESVANVVVVRLPASRPRTLVTYPLGSIALREGIPWRSLNDCIGTIGIRGSVCEAAEHAGIANWSGEARAVRIRVRRLGIARRNRQRRSRRGAAALGGLKRVAVVPVVEVAEDAACGAGRQHGGVRLGCASRNEAVPQRKEKRFVLHDRPANTDRVLD